MSSDLEELISGLSTLVLVIAVLSAAIFGIASVCERASCSNYEQMTGRSTAYRLFGGCFVQTESGWMTKNEYGQVIIAKDGLSK